MAGFDQYQAIPGHNAQFRDGNLNLKADPNPPTSESIVFLGTATDGPLNQPIQVTPDTANAIFGKVLYDNGVPNGATLIPAFEEAWQSGCRDIRLMRVTGANALASLAAATYSESVETIATETIGVAQGNAVVSFTLPHGGLELATVEVRANNTKLPSSAYTVSPGLSEDLAGSVEAEKAELVLDENVTDVDADILISYTYSYIDEESTEQTVDVVESNTDALGNPMVAKGEEHTFTLGFVPLKGLKLYSRGLEISNSPNAIFSVTGNQLVIKPSKKIRLGEKLEVSYAHMVTTQVEPTIELESVYGGGTYNETSVSVQNKDGVSIVTLTKPESKRSIMNEAPLVFMSTDYPTLQLMANAINTHASNNVVKATTDTPDILASSLQEKPETLFSGGRDELNLSKEDMYLRLGGETDEEGYTIRQGAYPLLENYEVDFVYPVGVYADDKLIGRYDNFAYQLALACAVMSHYNNVTMGQISTTTPSETSLAALENHVRKLEALDNTYYMRDVAGAIIKDGDGTTFDLGQFIQVLAGPDLVVGNTRLGQVSADSAAAYTGFVSNLPVQSAPTNKALLSVAGLRFEYSASQLNRLTANRFVTFKYKSNGRVGIVDAMTAAHTGSDYTRLSTARIVKEAVNAIREEADPYIGEPNDQANRNALTSAVDKRLGKMIEAKALLGFDFGLIVTPQMELIGEGQIELQLKAPNELRRLTTIVSLSV